MAGGVSFVCPAAFFIASGPWISFALANATALGLSADQMAALLELRHRFHVELRRPGVDAAALRRDIMRRAAALLTPEQRAMMFRLAAPARTEPGPGGDDDGRADRATAGREQALRRTRA